jgi:hypothetical protein
MVISDLGIIKDIFEIGSLTQLSIVLLFVVGYVTTLIIRKYTKPKLLKGEIDILLNSLLFSVFVFFCGLLFYLGFVFTAGIVVLFILPLSLIFLSDYSLFLISLFSLIIVAELNNHMKLSTNERKAKINRFKKIGSFITFISILSVLVSIFLFVFIPIFTYVLSFSVGFLLMGLYHYLFLYFLRYITWFTGDKKIFME